LPVALVHVVFFVAGLLVVTAFAAGDRFPSPWVAAPDAAAFFAAHTWPTRLAGFFQFSSAIPLGIFSATIVSRLRFLGIRPAGELIALFGGFAASVALCVSGLALWALADVARLPDALAAARALQLLSFAAGGPGVMLPMGLLLAGVSVSAGLSRKLHPWLAWLGLAAALVAELSTLTLILPSAVLLLPLSRAGAFVWLLGAAATLPATRAPTEAT
jgi:hypothetical protein